MLRFLVAVVGWRSRGVGVGRWTCLPLHSVFRTWGSFQKSSFACRWHLDQAAGAARRDCQLPGRVALRWSKRRTGDQLSPCRRNNCDLTGGPLIIKAILVALTLPLFALSILSTHHQAQTRFILSLRRQITASSAILPSQPVLPSPTTRTLRLSTKHSTAAQPASQDGSSM